MLPIPLEAGKIPELGSDPDLERGFWEISPLTAWPSPSQGARPCQSHLSLLAHKADWEEVGRGGGSDPGAQHRDRRLIGKVARVETSTH